MSQSLEQVTMMRRLAEQDRDNAQKERDEWKEKAEAAGAELARITHFADAYRRAGLADLHRCLAAEAKLAAAREARERHRVAINCRDIGKALDDLDDALAADTPDEGG